MGVIRDFQDFLQLRNLKLSGSRFLSLKMGFSVCHSKGLRFCRLWLLLMMFRLRVSGSWLRKHVCIVWCYGVTLYLPWLGNMSRYVG